MPPKRSRRTAPCQMSYSAMTEEEIEALMDLPMPYSRSGGEFIAQLTEATRKAETAKMVARLEEEDWAEEVARTEKQQRMCN